MLRARLSFLINKKSGCHIKQKCDNCDKNIQFNTEILSVPLAQ